MPSAHSLSQINIFQYMIIRQSKCVFKHLREWFERLVLNNLFNHFRDNNILISLQSGFIPGDSTVNQLNYLYNTFVVHWMTAKKAYDSDWHAGLLLKLKASGDSGTLLVWLKYYLAERRRQVVCSGAISDWVYIKAGFPQGSILGPLFLIFINDIVNDIGFYLC